MNNEICDFTIQDKKNCDFDWNDCENSELCLEFKQTLNCSDVKILKIKNQSKIVEQKWKLDKIKNSIKMNVRQIENWMKLKIRKNSKNLKKWNFDEIENWSKLRKQWNWNSTKLNVRQNWKSFLIFDFVQFKNYSNFQFLRIFSFIQFSILSNIQFCRIFNFVWFSILRILNFVHFAILSNFHFCSTIFDRFLIFNIFFQAQVYGPFYPQCNILEADYCSKLT